MTVIRLLFFSKFVQSKKYLKQAAWATTPFVLSVLSVAKVLSFIVFLLVVILPNKTIDSCFHRNDNHPVIIFLQIRTIEKIPQASCLSYNSVRVYMCYQWLKSCFLCLPVGCYFYEQNNRFPFSREWQTFFSREWQSSGYHLSSNSYNRKNTSSKLFELQFRSCLSVLSVAKFFLCVISG